MFNPDYTAGFRSSHLRVYDPPEILFSCGEYTAHSEIPGNRFR